ncbi:sensor histidine kinase [Lysinibacillus sp. LZ02]|uniref:sensor histidine kinase n=1 Tax=Lysinibacillus sp. LZ02 TaxID=3420668 RepID=UPI003D36BCC0
MAKIIGFCFRTLLLMILLSVFVYGALFLLYGQPSEKNWRPLIEESLYTNGMPYIVMIVLGIVLASFLISLWMTFIIVSKDFQTSRQIKRLLDIERYKEPTLSPRATRKSLTEVAELIDQQRKTLHRITNEKVEADETIVRQRLVEERQRLARELHDSVSQQLFAASMLLSSVTENNEDAAILVQIEKIVQQAQLEMRALLLHLRPIALQNKTLAQGLRELIEELQQKANMQLHYELADVPLTKAQEDHLFRIAQEALSNTLRHAKATDVELLLMEREKMYILRIQDNGVGFDMQDEKLGSYGLKNIVERATEIGGVCTVTSVVGQGTKIEVQIAKGVSADD